MKEERLVREERVGEGGEGWVGEGGEVSEEGEVGGRRDG